MHFITDMHPFNMTHRMYAVAWSSRKITIKYRSQWFSVLEFYQEQEASQNFSNKL